MSLSSKVKTAAMALVLAVMGAGATLVPTYAEGEAACDCAALKAGKANTCTAAEKAKCGMDDTGQKRTDADGNEIGLEDNVKNIINAVLYVVGILAVVMVIIGGVKYTTSGGDQSAVTSAKNMILYGIIGLVIAILAYSIVNFVIGRIS